ncbi:MAG: di-trans,poly-cis-decaprenylcistransferase, partial [Candidatus Gastranaerophilales bacterium]|nr:di-trans,poly-cis-decaprenylcistransferase [Candidatus Gastranaerophilales bacterium]
SAAGHKKGVDSLKKLIEYCIEFNIKYLTVYAFSTENWKRDTEEVNFLMSLLANTIKEQIFDFHKNEIKVSFLGNKNDLGQNLKAVIHNCEDETKNYNKLYLQIAFNYGARAEITNAVKNICTQVLNKEISISDINENLISSNLYTSNIPDPELLIRTGGEKRISNYLLWQCAYTEIYVTDVFWPDFDKSEFIKAILEFASRIRRFGK